MRLVTPEQMREMDRQTIEEIGLPGIVLMERASLGAVDALVEHFELSPWARIALMCGGGNNGGDGLAMARILAGRGFEVVIVLLTSPETLKGDAGTNFLVAERLGLPKIIITDESVLEEELEAIGDVDLWCDALLGTGLDREVEGLYARGIAFLNDRLAPVFAVDIPSGIHAESGQVMGIATEAEATATFGLPKLGQALYPGRAHCGDLYTIDIGIPEQVISRVGHEAVLITESWAQDRLPRRAPTYHKGDAGKLLILAGSAQKSGAALMTTRGALLSGAGLLTVGTVSEVMTHIPLGVPEAMSACLLSTEVDENCDARLHDALSRVDIVAMGPGIGTTSGPRQALGIVLDSEVSCAVFDADALNLLAEMPVEALSTFADQARVILTPHPGEMARLIDCPIAEVLERPVELARDLAQRTGAIVVLKIAATIIAAPDGRLAINSTGNPGMATGGMGDALTGIIAARQADIDDPFIATCLAVYAHGAAADAAAEELGQRGLTVTALLDALPKIWQRWEA